MSEPDEDNLEADPGSVAPEQPPARVIALRCRGCSALVPTDVPEGEAADSMQAECPTCHTVTVWRSYEVVDRPEPKAAEPDPAEAEPKPKAKSKPAGGLSGADAEALKALQGGASPRDAGVTAARAKELRAIADVSGQTPDTP